MLGLARADAAIEIARQRLKMAEQRTLLEQDLSNDAMKAEVMLWRFGNGVNGHGSAPIFRRKRETR